MVLDIHVVSNVKSIYDIDTVKQTFSVEAKYKLRWDATERDRQRWRQHQAVKGATTMPAETKEEESAGFRPRGGSTLIAVKEDFTPDFLPRIVFPNASNVTLSLKSGNKVFFKLEEAGDQYEASQIIYDFQIRCTFREFFELKSFPFDCQDLPIIMKLGGDADSSNYRFLPDAVRPVFGKVELENSVFTEWHVSRTMYEFGHTDVSLSKKGKTYPLYINRVKVQRQSGFYIQRIVLVLAFLSLGSLSSFAVNWDTVEDRLSIDFTILLTVVAFQYVVNGSLPVLPFLTIIDLYILFAQGFILLVILEQSLLIQLADDEEQSDFDETCFWISLIVWVVMQMSFLGYSAFKRRRERRKLTMNSLELHKYIKEEQNDGVLAHKMEFTKQDVEDIKAGKWCSGISRKVRHTKDAPTQKQEQLDSPDS